MLRAGILFLFSLWAVLSLQAQHRHHGYCGNGEGGEWDAILTERLLRNKLALEDQPVQFRSTIYVPLRIHMVANSSGFGRVTHAQVFDQLCKLNEDFADLDMQFYIKGINDNINNNGIYTTQYSAGLIMNNLKDPNALNIWIVDVAAGSPPSPGDLGVTLGYYSPTRDWVVIRRDEVDAVSATLSHEIGHFFSLKHTHNGWDSTPWSPAIGNPSPANSPGGVPTERQDGSNCNTAGDFICDTPPDFNGFGFNGCDYNIAQDPTGAFINPDELLFMSYFLNCPRDDYYFSPTQENLIITDYNSEDRNYLRTAAVTPNLTPIATAATPISPINNVFTPGYNIVNLQWNAVTGADFYLLEIDASQAFNSSPIRVVVSGATSHTMTTLQANRNYFWRVRPYNAYRTCAPFSATAQFRTNNLTVSTNNIEELNQWSVFPNPIGDEGRIQVQLQAARGFEGRFTLYDVAGRLVRRMGNQRISGGHTQIELDVADLLPGVYMLTLDHENGRELRRITVAK